MANCCSNLRMTILTFLEREQEFQTTVLLQGSSCMKEAQTDITFQGLWLWTAIAPMFPGAHATLQLNLMKLYLPTMRAGRKKSHHCHLRHSKKKHLTRLCACGAEEGPSMTRSLCVPPRPHSPIAPQLLHVLISGEHLLVPEHAQECICSITWTWISFLSLHVSAWLKCPPCPPEQRGGAQRQPQPPWWL